MEESFDKLINGYKLFRKKYIDSDNTTMEYLSEHGQKPKIMVVACSDSRVDPALLLQCDPGDLFVVRNVANIVPPYEKDDLHHGTSAALEFAINYLEVKHLIILGHSQCGGINALLYGTGKSQDDFITNWVSVIKPENANNISEDSLEQQDPDEYAKIALHQSQKNCMAFPWIKDRVNQKMLTIHSWFFDIKTGQIYTYSKDKQEYELFA